MPHNEYPYYRRELPRQSRELLQLSAAELGPQLTAPTEIVQYILDHPDFVPRDDIIGQLEKALYLREGYFRQGSGEKSPFTNKQARDRLKRYEQLYGRGVLLCMASHGAQGSARGMSDIRAPLCMPSA